MEGVSEQHIIGMAAGLAMTGKQVYFNTIATFITRRCLEQNAIDLGLANVKVRLLGSGGGLVYAPLGPTHLATEDITLMRAIPNMTIVAPCDAEEMERAMMASERLPGPLYVRIAKGGEAVVSKPEHGFEYGKAIVHKEAGDLLFVTTGVMLSRALEAAHRAAGWAGDAAAFGRSGALLVGDLLVAWSDDLMEDALAEVADKENFQRLVQARPVFA